MLKLSIYNLLSLSSGGVCLVDGGGSGVVNVCRHYFLFNSLTEFIMMKIDVWCMMYDVWCMIYDGLWMMVFWESISEFMTCLLRNLMAWINGCHWLYLRAVSSKSMAVVFITPLQLDHLYPFALYPFIVRLFSVRVTTFS